MSSFPVFMYHRIVSEECPIPESNREENRYAVTLAEFVNQLDFIVGAGQMCVSMSQIHEQLSNGGVVPDEWVGLTFDDGNKSDYVHALPLLSDRGFSATFYVCGSRIGEPGGLDPSQIRELGEGGMHVGAHGLTHRFLNSLTGPEEKNELQAIKSELTAITGNDITHFAPPGGRYTSRTLAQLRDLNYVAVATSQFGFNGASGPRFIYSRIPVMRTTSVPTFVNAVKRRRGSLWSSYLRSGGLALARNVLGDVAYRRLRRVGLGH